MIGSQNTLNSDNSTKLDKLNKLTPTDPIKSIYNDLGLELAGVDFDKFSSTFKTNADARKSIYKDLRLESAGVTYDTFETKLGLKKQPPQVVPANPIYQFLKENSLTDLDEASFASKYSDSNKAKEIYTFFRENSLTDLDEGKFYDKYLKREVKINDWSAPVKPATQFNLAEQSNPKLVADVEAKQQKQANRLSEINKVYDQAQGAGTTNAIQQHDAVAQANTTRENEIESNRAGGVLENVSNFTERTVMGIQKGIVDASSGLLGAGRDLFHSKTGANKIYNEDGSLSEYSQKTPDDLAEIIIGLDGYSKDLGELLEDRQLSDHMVGRGFQTVSDIMPDIVASGLFPEAKVAEGLGVAGKYVVKALTNPFTKTLVARKAIEGYRQANLEGKDQSDKVVDAVVGGLHGAQEGSEMYLMGELGNAFGKTGAKLLEKAGWKPGAITKGAVDLAANYAVWGSYGTGKALIDGNPDPLKAGNDSGFLGMMFAAKGLYEHGSHNSEANAKFVKEFIDADNQLKTEALFRATPESIKEVAELKGTAEEFHAKGLDYAEQAMKETDPEKKTQLITASSAFKKIADVKQGIESISLDKKSWLETVDKSALEPEVADAMKAKVEAIYKDYNPDEIEKSVISEKILNNRKKVKAKKEMASEDPIQSAKDEVELESVHEELRADNETLKNVIRNESSPIAEILPGEKFSTLDGTRHRSAGRDLKTGEIFTDTGKSIPFDQVDVTKLNKKETPDSTPAGIKPEVTPEIIPDQVQNTQEVKKARKVTRVEEAPVKVAEEVKSPEIKEEAPTELNTEADFKTLSNREIDRITRTTTTKEPDLNSKQNYQAVLKKKFSDLGRIPAEDLETKVQEFVNTVHDYRNKNRIKSDKTYNEPGTKEQFNGLNYWIDSIAGLYAKKSGRSKSSVTQEITRMRSDWAKQRLPKDLKDDVIQKPANTLIKPKAIKKVKENPFKSSIDEILTDTQISKDALSQNNNKIKDGLENTSNDDYSQVGFTPKGKPVFVMKSRLADYERYMDAIEKKIKRIQDSDYSEGSNEATERKIIDQLKIKVKDLEINPTSFKTQTTQSAKDASLLDKAEAKLNELSESGKRDLKSGRKDLGSFISPDTMIGASKVVAAEAGKVVIKSVRGLEKILVKLITDGRLKENELAKISPIEKINLLKLVQAEQAILSSGKTSGELMANGHEENRSAVKRIQKENGLFSQKTINKLREELWDFDGNLVQTLNKDGSFKPKGSNSLTETYGERAERLLKTIPAAYSKSEAKYLDAISKVYGSGVFGKGKVKSLTSGEQKLLSDIAMFRRVIELDTQRLAEGQPLMEHPGGLDIVQAKQRLKDIESKDPSIVEKFGDYDFKDLTGRVDEYYKVLQDLVDYRYSNGLISKSAYDRLKSIKYYSPRVFLKHLVDADGFYSNKPTIQKTIKTINEGSKEEVVTNLAKLMADAINIVYETSARNTSTKAIADIIEENPDIEWGKTAQYTTDFLKRLKANQEVDSESSPGISGADEVRVDEVSKYKYIEPSFKPAPTGFQLKVYRDGGIKRGFYIKNELATELDGLRLDGNKWLRQASLAPTVRSLATATNWYFSLTNPIRDAGYAMFTTPHYSRHFPVALAQYSGDFISSVKDAFTKTGKYKEYAEQGGASEYTYREAKLYSGEESTTTRDLNHLVDLIAHRLPSTFENAGRLAVRKRVIKNLEDKAKDDGIELTPKIKQGIEEQASYQALKVLNFAEGGKLVKQYNQYTPFVNAGVIASRNLVRYAKSNPKEFSYKVAQLAGYVAALSAWNNGLIGSDKNKEMGDYYSHNISEHEKASSFIIMTPMRYKNSDGILQYLYLKIPKSQDQMLFAGLAEYGSMNMAGIDSYTKEKYLDHRSLNDLKGLISFLPEGGNLIPPIAKGWAGYVTDHDFFIDKQFTKSSEMASRKPEDEYDPLHMPERWKTITKPLGLSPIRLQGAFKSTIPTNNQWFDAADYLYTKAFGEDTKAIEIRNQTEGTAFEKFEKQMDNAGASEEEKQEIYKTLILDVLPKSPGFSRLIKLTSPATIDEDREDFSKEDASRVFHETEQMKISAYEFKKDNITKEELINTAKTISNEPEIIKRAINQAKAAIKFKRGNPDAFDIIFSGVSSPEGQARLLFNKVRSMRPLQKNKLIGELRGTGLFSSPFWREYKKLESEK